MNLHDSPTRRFLLAMLALLLLGGVLCTRAAFISAPDRVDMVHDPLRNVLYISSGSSVLRYDLATQSFLSPFNLTGNLGGMDLSPDGNTLAIADRTRSDTNVWIHLVDLNTGTSQRAFFPRAFYEGGTYTVAWGADGAVMVSSTFEGSGWVPLRRYNPANGDIKEVASINQSSMLAASGDRKIIGIEESNISSGPVDRYDVYAQVITNSAGTGWFNYEVGVNKDGTQAAAPTYGGTFIYNAQMQQITNLGVYAGQQPIGVAYHSTKDAVYFAWAGTAEVRAFDTYTFSQLGSYTTTTTFSAPGNAAFVYGRIKLSRDGTLLFVTTSGGVDWFTNTIPVPSYRWVTVEGDPGRLGTPQPQGYGRSAALWGTILTNSVDTTVESAGIRYNPNGASVAGAVAFVSASNRVALTVSNDVGIIWNWKPYAYQLTVSAAGLGTVNTPGGWFNSNTVANLTATPQAGSRFIRWLGDVPENIATNTSIGLTMTQPRRAVALFGPVTGGQGVTLPGEWPTFGRGPAHNGYFSGVVGNATFNLRWKAVVGGSLQQVAVGGGRIFATPYQYFGSAFLASIHEYSGQSLWWYAFSSAYSINPPTYDAGSVFVQRGDHSSDTHLWNFDAGTGQTNWVSPHAAQWERYMAPCVADGSVWVNGGYYGGIYGFNRADGAQKFFLSLEQYDGWTPTYHQGRLFSFVAGNFREHDPNAGTVLWTTSVGWDWSGWTMDRTVAASGTRAFFIGNPNLYALDLDTHQVTWSVAGSFTGTPAVANGLVYALTSSGVSVYADVNGQYLTNLPIASPQSQPIVTDDAVIVASSSETRIFDLGTFALKQTIPVGGYLSLANGVLYIATSGGEIYAYSSGPDVTLVVNSAGPQIGNPFPFVYGTNWIAQGSQITPSVNFSVTNIAGTRFANNGWTGTGSIPPAGTTNQFICLLTNNSTLTWLWKTQYFLATTVNSNGSVSVASGWFDAGAVVPLIGSPSNYFHFDHWEGDAAGMNPSVSVTMTAPRSVTAFFAPDLVTNNTPTWWLAKYGLPTTDAGALQDNDNDGLPNWREYQFDTNPLVADTDGDGYNDGLEVARGSSPTNPGSIPLVQIIIAGSPSPYGTPQTPGYGTNLVPLFSVITNTVATSVPGTNGQRFACTGWAGSGDVPATGSSNTVVFTVQTNSTLTWLWQMQFQLVSQVVSNGSIAPAAGWFMAGSNLTMQATPATYFTFQQWTGDLQGSTSPVNLLMNGPKTVTASFVPDLVINGVPKWWLAAYGLPVNDAGALADTDADGLENWREFQYQTNPTLPDTDGDGYSDGLEVARGSNPTSPASIPLVGLTITSSPAGIGSPQPQGYGAFNFPLFAPITNAVTNLAYLSSGLRYQNLGWTGSGNVPASGATNIVAFSLNTNSTLSWLWQVQYALTIATNFSAGNGLVPRSQLATLLAGDGTNYDGLGWSVAMDGDIAVVGAPFSQGTNPNILGGAYVFRKNGGNWNFETRLDGSDPVPKSFVGCTVSVRSNRLAMGALTTSGPSRYCTAYVYVNSGSTWVREAVLTTSQPAVDWDAWSVGLGENFLAIGASADPFRGSMAGSVFVFRRTGSTWNTSGLRVTPTDYKPYQYFGWSVAAAGTNLLVVGAPGDTVGRNYSGAAYVFRVSSAQSYTQEAKLVPAGVAPNAALGSSVGAIEGLAVAGAPWDETSDVSSGAAYVYLRTNGVWTNVIRLSSPANEAYGAFGYSVAVATNGLLIGAPQTSGSSLRSGAAYLYRAAGATWLPHAQTQPATDTGEDKFGLAVALTESSALIGAPDSDWLALDAGAAFAFDAALGGTPGWWNGGTLANTFTAPDTLTRSNTVYRFVGWELDGAMQVNNQGTAINPLTGLLMNQPHTALLVYLPENEDADADSLPDWWERRYLGTLESGATSDPDGDGFSNWQEWRAGTNPADPGSALRLGGQVLAQSNTNTFMLQWPGVSGKWYRVYRATNILSGYSCVASNLAATPPLNYFPVPLQPGAAFFRIQLE